MQAERIGTQQHNTVDSKQDRFSKAKQTGMLTLVQPKREGLKVTDQMLLRGRKGRTVATNMTLKEVIQKKGIFFNKFETQDNNVP